MSQISPETETLLPCPFCGKAPHHHESWVWCSGTCDIGMGSNDWNTRGLAQTPADADDISAFLNDRLEFLTMAQCDLLGRVMLEKFTVSDTSTDRTSK